MSLSSHQRDWNELGQLDPFWAVLSDPAKRFGNWHHGEFFATGEREVAAALSRAGELGFPKNFEQAVDFGCGLGRTARALASRFNSVVGLDISEPMVTQARELNKDVPNCEFRVHVAEDLASLASNSVDLVYSSIVLQHVPIRAQQLRYIAEFIRVLKPGGIAIFQLPSRIPLLFRLQPRRRLYNLLHAIGVPKEVIYKKLGVSPIRMRAVPESIVRDVAEKAGAKVLAADNDTGAGPHVESKLYFVAKQQ